MLDQRMVAEDFREEVDDDVIKLDTNEGKNEIFKEDTGVTDQETEKNSDEERNNYLVNKILRSLNQMGNAARFIKFFASLVRYCEQLKGWLVYDCGRWIEKSSILFEMFKDVIKDVVSDAECDELTQKEKDKVHAFANRSSSGSGFTGMLNAAKFESHILVDQNELDADPLLLNCPNGTMNLKTFELQPHRPEDLLTKMVNTPYDPEAKCSLWNDTLVKIMGNDQEKIKFLQRLFGYSLTGLTTEQCLSIYYGGGSNGKSTVIEVQRELMGDYAANTPSDSFLRSRSTHNTNDLARLKGIRFVSAVEIESGQKLNETKVKQVTGGDKVTARFLFKEFFEYSPEYKIVIATNHLPDITGVDDGIWRRLMIVPFDVSITNNEIDKNLKSKLRQELSGILNWALEGCKEYQNQGGLNAPQSIISATQKYRNRMDQVAGFIHDKCLENPNYRVKIADLHTAYQRWADMVGLKPYGKINFGKIMVQKGFDNSAKSGSSRYWTGLKLK
jgi:putative DNA primase/helicase